MSVIDKDCEEVGNANNLAGAYCFSGMSVYSRNITQCTRTHQLDPDTGIDCLNKLRLLMKDMAVCDELVRLGEEKEGQSCYEWIQGN